MRALVSSSKTASFLAFAAAAILAGAAGCGSNSPNQPPAGPDAAIDAAQAIADGAAAPVDSGVAVDGGASGEVAQAQEAGISTASYCTAKPALTSVNNVGGTWVVRALATQEVHVLGTVLHPKTAFYMLTTMTQAGTAVVADGRYCDRSELDNGSLVTVIIPDAWAHTEKPFHRSGTLTVGNDGLPVLDFPTLVELAGAVADATTDELPTNSTDPRVIDEDNDGHLGITVDVTGQVTGSLYSVQRQTTAILAVPVANDRFEGALSFLSEEKVLASDPALLASLYATALAITDPTPCTSTFAMVKVADGTSLDAGGAPIDCAWVRANETILFPN